MITTNEVRNNVTQYNIEEHHRVVAKVTELINIMSKSIEFHSKNENGHLNFLLFNRSLFHHIIN